MGVFNRQAVATVWCSVALLGLCMVTSAQVLGSSRPQAIFQHVKAALPDENPVLQEGHPYQPVIVRRDVLRALRPGSRVLFNLSVELNLVGIVQRVERRAADRYSCFGRLEGWTYGSFILVEEEGAVAMSLIAPGVGTYELIFVREGLYAIIPSQQQLPCGNRVDLPRPQFTPRWEDYEWRSNYLEQINAGFDENSPPRLGLMSCNQPQAVLDTAVYYTTQARQAVGGVAQMHARIQLYIDQCNEAYRNSQIDLRMRLVRRLEVSYPGEGNNNYETQIYDLTRPNDGVLDEIHPDRTNYRADQVVLLVSSSNVCGVAWCGNGADPEYAFSVVNVDSRYCPAIVFTHEVGHNQGCGHDRENGGCGFRPYAYGWRFTGNDGRTYRTVMAYPPGIWIPYFSNPDIIYQGFPTGVPIGQANEAHNAYVVNETRRSRETFRLLDIWVQFNYIGTERGTFTQPFNTVAEGVSAITTFLDTSLVPFPTLYIKAGSTSERIRITKRLRIEACGGTVRIGRQ